MQEDEIFSRKIYISNIPHTTSKEELRRLFAICGQIENVSIYPFTDNKNIERAYGFVEFSNVSSARKAAFFNEKVYKQHVIYVTNDKQATYNILVKNLQPHVDEILLKAFFEEYGPVKMVTKLFPKSGFVNFESNSTRLQVLNTPVLMTGVGQLSISLAEPYNKMDYSNHLTSEQFTVYVANIPCRVSKEELQTMFELFGQIISANIVAKGAIFNYGFVSFATERGRNAALKFNGEQPDGWERQISIANQNSESKSAPANVSKHVMPKTFIGSNSVRVTGFGMDVQEDALRRFFASAGTIMECFIQVSNGGERYAIVNFEKADSVTKAISYSECYIGAPSKKIYVIKPPQAAQQLSAAKSALNLATSNHQEPKFQRAVSEMPLRGNSVFLVVMDNVSKKMTSESVQRLFKNCGTMLQPPEIVLGDTANMAKIFFATRECAEKAKNMKLPPGAGGRPMECYISETNLSKIATSSPLKPSSSPKLPSPAPVCSPSTARFEESLPTISRNDISVKRSNSSIQNLQTTAAPSLSHMTVENTPPTIIRQGIQTSPRAYAPISPTPNHPAAVRNTPAVARVEPIRRSLSDHQLTSPTVNVFSSDKFENMVRINSGGFGTVYKASTLQSGLVAVKLFHSPASKDTQREVINMINHSTHPNIVRFLGVVTISENNQDIMGFVMEYLGDQTVYHATHVSSMSLSIRMIYSWICQAARGLDYLHSRRIVHRDVKTLNMLLDNSYKHLRVCDLGISKSCNESLTGGIVGTKEYTAPEVLRASGHSQNEYDTKADVYSLGICIWEILTKLKPYDPVKNNISNLTFYYKVMNEGLRPDCSFIADPDIRSFVSRCWAFSPIQRPSMEEIVMFFDKQERENSVIHRF